MKLGIIGAGNVGTGLAKHLIPMRHEVMFSFGKDAAKLSATARAYGATAGTVAEAVAFADVVVLATPYAAIAEALAQAGTPAQRKVVWDCTNALKPDMSGLAVGTTWSAAEEVQQRAPWARVVKGIPPFAETLHSDRLALNGGPVGVFVCSDDAPAKAEVAGLLSALGMAVTDAGPLKNARYVEPAAFLVVQLAYAMGRGSRIGLALVTD